MPSDPNSETGKSQGRGRSNSLPAHVVEYLKAWLMSPDHISHPYPTEKEKEQMVADTGIELKRLNNWFVNNRIRYWKPRMEALQKQQEDTPPLGADEDHTKGGNLPISPSSDASPANFSKQVIQAEELNAKKDQRIVYQLTPERMPRASLHAVSDASTSTNESVSSSDEFSLSDNNNSSLPDPEVTPRSEIRGRKRPKDVALPVVTPQKRIIEDESFCSPRSKYSRKDADLWRKACVLSTELYDDSLPTLDEATRLFGFSSN